MVFAASCRFGSGRLHNQIECVIEGLLFCNRSSNVEFQTLLGSLFGRDATQFVKLGKTMLIGTPQWNSNGLHAREKGLIVKEFLDGESNHIRAVSCAVHADSCIEEREVFLGDSE